MEGMIIKFLSNKYAKVYNHNGYDICALKEAVPSEGDELGYRIDDKRFEGNVFSHPDGAIEAINIL